MITPIFRGSSLLVWATICAGAVLADPPDSSPFPVPRPLVESPDPGAQPDVGLPDAIVDAVLRGDQNARSPLAVQISPRPIPRAIGLAIDEAPVDTTAEATVLPPEDFDEWRTGFLERARAAGISQAVLDRTIPVLTFSPRVVELDRNQSEFNRQLWDYLDSAVSDNRVANGRVAVSRQAAVLDRIEDQYGVDGHVVAAIWGLESAYGAVRGDIGTLDALATLAFEGRRAEFFESQLIAALRIIEDGDVTPAGMRGSWAGAMGHTQFMPLSYLEHAQDFDGDGRRNIWADEPEDALASAAAYLAANGWVAGQPWGMEVVLPPGFDFTQSGERIRRPVAEWTAMGVRLAAGGDIPDHGDASILLPGGSDAVALVIWSNFQVIETYNPADAYVIAVGHLADRIAGGPAFQGGWPRGDRAFTFEERVELQERLIAAGIGLDRVDGIIGPETIQAVREYQAAEDLVPDGYANVELLQRLR